MNLQEYNLQQKDPYFATGQSCYFNEQIDNFGLSNLKLNPQDIEDARFISNCFGIETHYLGNNTSIIYATLLGTTEFNYGIQTFSAGIFEDVFQCSVTHELPINPKVGELEQDFYLRLLNYQIDNTESFDKEKKEETLLRGKRLINNFCNGKNRVYLIKLSDILQVKASFGDVVGLRDGSYNNEQFKQEISALSTLNELLKNYNIDYHYPYNLYLNPNLTSEYGVALYASIPIKKLNI